jgi:hypothetical protein
VTTFTLSPETNLKDMNRSTIISAEDALQDIITSPVQLVVGYNTALLMNVTCDLDSTRHVFTCRLLDNSSGLGVNNRTVTLRLNSTVYTFNSTYPNLRTDASGYAWLALYLTPQGDGNLTYSVVASFSGDGVSTATASLITINGTSYVIYTTARE